MTYHFIIIASLNVFQVWFTLLVSIVAAILLMSLFSWIYKKYPQTVSITKNEEVKSDGTARTGEAGAIVVSTEPVRGVSYYFIYVMDILTNHGKYTLIMIYISP